MFGELDSGAVGMTSVAVGTIVNVTGYANVHIVRIDLDVANQTGKYRPISRIGVAGGAVGPCSVVRAGIYREEVSIVFGIIRNLAGSVLT